MVKKLRFSRIDLVERVGALLLVTLLDDDGNMYQWAPKWADIEELLPKVAAIERFNKPESEWLNKFAKTVQSVVEGAQRITSARKIDRSFKSYSSQNLIIGNERCVPGFEVTLPFLDEWLGRNVQAFLVNDVVIRLSFGYVDQNDEYQREDYPPTEEDIPFE
jgi:hypothetical protein